MKMTDSEKNLEEIIEEYLLLLQDGQYHEVIYDEESGGVSAIHQEHRFDKQPGPFGVRRGVYELMAIDALRKKGHVVILESERAPDGVKTPDGKLDGKAMDIKAIENTGQWTIKNGLFRILILNDTRKPSKRCCAWLKAKSLNGVPQKNKAAGAALLEGVSQQVLKSTSQPFACKFSKSF